MDTEDEPSQTIDTSGEQNTSNISNEKPIETNDENQESPSKQDTEESSVPNTTVNCTSDDALDDIENRLPEQKLDTCTDYHSRTASSPSETYTENIAEDEEISAKVPNEESPTRKRKTEELSPSSNPDEEKDTSEPQVKKFRQSDETHNFVSEGTPGSSKAEDDSTVEDNPLDAGDQPETEAQTEMEVSENEAELRQDSDEDEVRSDLLHQRGGVTGLSAKPKVKNLRRNIRDILAEEKLDEHTLAAQKEEQLRLMRLQEKRVAMREYMEQQQVERLVAVVAEAAEAQDTTIKSEPCEEEPVEEKSKPEEDDEDIVILSSEDEESTPQVTSDTSQKKPTQQMWSHSHMSHFSDSSESEDEEEMDIKKEGSDDSDSDVVVLSNSEEEEDEDESNSGSHINDAFNTPDVNGQVLVNVGHPEKEDNIYLAPQLAAAVKPHQIGGIRFLYDNIVESLEQFKTTNGFGCILAHSMGLGKTLQVISLTDVFLRYTGSRSVLIIVPINTIQNWVSEYNGWLPEEVAPHLVGQVRPRQFKVFVLNDGQKNMKSRAKVVKEWHDSGGVLLMGYELYRQLSLKKPKKSKKAKKRLESTVDLEEEDINMELLDEMNKALVNPGPDLVICDEGHRIKNAHANISQALKSIRTKRRIVLTGYPLQNSLIEYWCMVDFVRPNYLGNKAEFCNMFERPIQNGQCVDSTPQDVKVMRYRAHVLHSLLEGFVQRRGHSVLERSLPPKYEHVLLCRMLPIQKQLYTAYMSDLSTHKGMANPLRAFAICCKIWNHPDILYNLMRKRNSEYYDLDLDEMVGKPGRPKKRAGQKVVDKQLNGSTSKQPLPPWGPHSTPIRTEPSSAAPSFSSNAPLPIDSTNTVPMTNQSMMPSNSMNGTQSMMGMGYGGYNNMYNMPVQNYGQMPQYPWNYNQNFPRAPHNDPYASTYGNSYGQYGATPSVDPASQTDAMPVFPPVSMPESSQSLIPNSNIPESLSSGSYPSQSSDSSCPPYSMASNGLPGPPTYSSSTLMAPQPNPTETKPEPFPTANGPTPPEDEPAVQVNTASTIPGDLQRNSEGLDNSGDKLQEDKKEDLKKEEAPLYFAESAFEGYVPGLLENSSKFVIFFKILEGCLKLGDRLLVFSQSLFTLSLLEEFLGKNHIYGTNEFWARNRTYFRLDGSTSAQEREKLINDFNANTQVRIFLVSTRAGSLGINLVGANRVVVFDASFNPCHDTQAVCRVYRYGQQKTSHIYRLVTDNSLEKRIYDRQINKQGIADRIVDEMNPDAHLSSKEISNLLVEKEDEPEPSDFKVDLDKIEDPVFLDIVTNLKEMLTRAPFTHESLLVDRKDKKLSTAEKRLAKRSYEIEKQANNSGSRGSYAVYQKTATGGLMYPKNLGGLRPMDSEMCKKVQGGRLVIQRPNILSKAASSTPVESLAKQGVSVQQIKIPKDVSIPTNSGDGKPIQLKAGQNVMVIKTLKGMYLRLTDGKIVAIRTGNDTFGLPLEHGGITIVPSTAGNKPKDPKPIIPARRGRPPLSAQYALGQIVPKAAKGQMVRVFRKPVISGRGTKSYQTIAVPSHSSVVKKSMLPNMLKELKPSPKTEITTVDDKDKFKTFLPSAGTSGLGKEKMAEELTKPSSSIIPKSEPSSLVPPSLPGLGQLEPKKEEPLTEAPINLKPLSNNPELPDKKDMPITVPTIPEMILQPTHTPNLSSSLSKMHLPTISESFQNSPATHITDAPPIKNSMELPPKNPLDQSPMFTNFNTMNREGTQGTFPENNASNFPMGLPPPYSSNNQPLFQPFLQHPNTSQSDTNHGDSNPGNEKPWQLPSKQNESFHPPHPAHHSSAMESFNTRQFIPTNPPTTSLSTPITTSSEHKPTPQHPDPMAAPLLPPMGSSYPQSGLSSEPLMSHNFPNYSSAFRRMDFPVPEMQPNQITTTNNSLPPSYSASQSTPNSPYSVYGSYNNLGTFRGSGMNPGYAPYPGQFFPPQYPNTMPNSVLPYPDLPQQQNPYDLYQPPVSNPYTSGSFGQGAPYPPM